MLSKIAILDTLYGSSVQKERLHQTTAWLESNLQQTSLQEQANLIPSADKFSLSEEQPPIEESRTDLIRFGLKC